MNLNGLNHPAEIDQKNAMPRNKSTKSPPSKRKKLVKRIVIILLVLYVLPTFLLVKDAKATQGQAKLFSAALKSQNLDQIKSSSTALRSDLNNMKRDLLPFTPFRLIPFFGAYVSDANHFVDAGIHGLNVVDIAATELTPYADVLGLKGKDVGGPGTAQERIQTAVAAIQKITPKMDQIAVEFTTIRKDIDQVDPNRYPASIRSIRIRDNLAVAKSLVDTLSGVLSQAKPIAQVLPSILGEDSPKTYLVLFQNDKELRPSGGFLTAYTYMTVDKGKISASDSNDIYNLDETVHKACQTRVCPELRPPALIVKYLPEATGARKTAWDSRDSNIHPDWVASTLEFKKFYSIAGGRKIDGIIGVDTYVIKNLLAVTGPIKVPGYSTTFTQDNVVNELEGYAENVFKGSPDRKSLLGDLMASVMHFITSAGKDKMQPLVTTGISLLNEKHILIALNDQQAQSAIEAFNWAGRIKVFNGDYRDINDANFASGKANMFINERIEDNVDFAKDGNVEHTLNIYYQNTGSYSDTLDRNYRDAVRIYVPQGSKLVSSNGAVGTVSTYDEFGKTVFEAFMFTRTKGKSQLTLKYEIPIKYKKGDTYQLMLQKQPGTDGWEQKLDLFGNRQAPFILKQDQIVTSKI